LQLYKFIISVESEYKAVRTVKNDGKMIHIIAES